MLSVIKPLHHGAELGETELNGAKSEAGLEKGIHSDEFCEVPGRSESICGSVMEGYS